MGCYDGKANAAFFLGVFNFRREKRLVVEISSSFLFFASNDGLDRADYDKRKRLSCSMYGKKKIL